MRSLRERFLSFDDALAAQGVPRLTDWWRRGVGEWLDRYEAGGALELWACCGRGSAKSTANYKLGAFFALFGDFHVPVGERHFAIVLSRLKEEAAKGISIIAAWLRALGVRHRVAGDVIELADRPRGIRVVAASVAATSGWRAFFIGKDERSKWPASAASDDADAEEIDTSAAAMTATHARAPACTFGSAWGAYGAFYDAINGGTTADRVVLGPAPTWIAAPHISRADCEKKERHPGRFAREFECRFQSGDLDALSPDLIDPCFGNELLTPIGRRVGAIDAASGKGDCYRWGFASYGVQVSDIRDIYLYGPPPVRPDGRPVLGTDGKPVARGPRLDDGHGNPQMNWDWRPESEPALCVGDFGGVSGAFASHTSAQSIVNTICVHGRRLGVTTFAGDQHNAYANASLFAANGCELRECTWTTQSKLRALNHVRRLAASRCLHLENDPVLRQQLLELRESARPSGAVVVTGRGGHVGDRAAVVLTLALADLEGLISGSPHVERRGARAYGPGDFANS